MSRLVESICVIDGKIRNIEYHQRRFEYSSKEIFGFKTEISLEKEIREKLKKEEVGKGKFKCRVVYDSDIELIEFNPYEVRNINSVKLIFDDNAEYAYKFTDRKLFDELKKEVIEDEIIIVKNGKITDTSYSNLVFFDGNDWITPKDYLLPGTMRRFLLDNEIIKEKVITLEDLSKFKSFKLINAMLNLEESPELDISLIRF